MSRKNKIQVEVRENGSRNHPWYVNVYVNNSLVDKKSFMTEKEANENKHKFVEDLLVDAVKKLRKISRVKLYCGKFGEQEYSLFGDRE
jgi:hypothetical protein